MGRSAVVIGAGITGAAAVWQLGQLGYAVRVFEREQVVGGHVRTEWMHGIPYEPHGAHIFHTTDEPVWRLVTKLADFVPYRHRVVIRVRGQLIPWPIQRSAVSQLPDGAQLVYELNRRPTSVDTTNFETYCVSLLGRTLYDECVGPYTVKQWGRDPHTLSASVAKGRVELRDDGYLDFFRDPFQGWPRAGYGMLVEAMLQEAEVNLGTTVTADHMSDVAARGEPVIVTSALDDFFAEPGALPWRGVRLESTLLRGVTLAQPAMVVNEPALAVPWTRTIETKWALDDLHDISGTVVMREFPGADAKHYPVLDAAGTNLATQASLERRLTAFRRNPIIPAGRLAGYGYINMDVAIRRGLNAATQIATEAHR
ncbi:UDP-galactopyranose mutase [Salinispora mooreana]|uniref:UDP-galactopyranose mutase n=1 Tax=Salinispora mooreana TaxID=999545 RepID=UPI0003663F37|nr:UDP-galactopyranose mutase [Salinispora mooreana]